MSLENDNPEVGTLLTRDILEKGFELLLRRGVGPQRRVLFLPHKTTLPDGETLEAGLYRIDLGPKLKKVEEGKT